MKKNYFAIIILTLIYCFNSNLKAQLNANSEIESFGVRFVDGNPSASSSTFDSLVYIQYVVDLTDTIDVSKIHVKISSNPNTNGNLLSTSYSINSAPIFNNGNCIFKREGLKVSILTIQTTLMADNKYEVSFEDNQGQIAQFISWKN